MYEAENEADHSIYYSHYTTGFFDINGNCRIWTITD